MPKPQPKRKPKPPLRPAAPPTTFEPVDPRWILKALGATLAAAVLCAYIVLCGMFYRGQWQLVLSPSRAISSTPAALGLSFTEVHFADDATGQPQLDGWWLPADSPSSPTVLILHSGQGSMSDSLPAVQMLHNVHLNVLLFDYRGFGKSGGQHPTEALMQSDAESAFRYLTETRSVSPSSIVVYGTAAGGSLAVNLCAEHKNIAALILDSPDGDFESRVRTDPRGSMVPVGWLFNETFPLAAPLHTLATPKLLISSNVNGSVPADFQQAANPKTTLEVPLDQRKATIPEALTRFLDAYMSRQS